MRELNENELRSVEGGKNPVVYGIIGWGLGHLADAIIKEASEYDHTWDSVSTPH
ncbi:MAG: class IIb bacteriocin, lactobin A/cerein 7B family [Candidatus Mcinerneyibacterium aminivorans]|jgi:lactobin A/cerein 7B family class IIb bacteriocin|uniref:Class IIb bacteriocin, lactobin A/cerein 7B family n=1 Tax=Candidatus Mcinerneyibacterium aminivorans TaxID=2703815 RepID=A0A5D0MG55_9BACT|nr:MAG: class IIb bacteriocin, lactobin A/cerein 7B family [Candidatus Mcinerneyibacterium aminivorans]